MLGEVADHKAKPHGSETRLSMEQFQYEAGEDRYVCPTGKYLPYLGQERKKGGRVAYKYRALERDCRNCVLRSQCCPQNRKHGRSLVRTEESAAMVAFRKKMETEQAQTQYRIRGPVAEFRNCWIKSKLGLWTFHVRGLVRAQAEALWICFTHNLQQWMRLRRPTTVLASV